MEIKIRNTGRYLEVKIVYDSTIIDLGLLNDEERKNLASTLEEAAEELRRGIDE